MTRIRDYFMEHVRPMKNSDRFYVVTKPLHVFKKVEVCASDVGAARWKRNQEAIANLVVPVGAKVHCSPQAFDLPASSFDRGFRKMRASKAKVHSVVLLDRTRREVPIGRSSYAYWFFYKPGATVTSTQDFSLEPSTCASGIHFFLTLTDARNYQL